MPETTARACSERRESVPPTTSPGLSLSPDLTALRKMHALYQDNFRGRVASYIPELARTDPQLFGIALATADWQVYEVGDSSYLFTM